MSDRHTDHCRPTDPVDHCPRHSAACCRNPDSSGPVHSKIDAGTRVPRRRGFTLIEIMVVLIIVMLLISLLLPAIQNTREQARRTQCANNLLQIGIALHSYQSSFNVLPPGCVNAERPVPWQGGYQMSWIAQIMPQLGQEAIYRRIDFIDPRRSFLTAEELVIFDAVSNDADIQTETAEVDVGYEAGGYESGMGGFRLGLGNGLPMADLITLSTLICPSSSMTALAGGADRSDYAGCHHSRTAWIDEDNDGLLYLNSSESLYEIPDGASTTILVSEKLMMQNDAGWMTGDYSTLRNAGTSPDFPAAYGRGGYGQYESVEVEEDSEVIPAAGFSSYHSGVQNYLFADGSVKALHQKIGLQMLQKLASRLDGSLVSKNDF